MKKTCLWSNSKLIGELGSDVVSSAPCLLHPLHVSFRGCWLWFAQTHTSLLEEMRATAAPLVRRYVDSKGKTRFTGVKKKLKNSQPGPERLHIWYTHKHCEYCLCLEILVDLVTCVLSAAGCTLVHLAIGSGPCCRTYAPTSRDFVHQRSLWLLVADVLLQSLACEV